MSPLQVGLLGAGGMGDKHARIIEHLEDARVGAVCDLNLERARAVAGRSGARAYDHFEGFMDAEEGELDALFICIPTFARRVEHVARAAEAGIHLFVEKPLALSLEAAEAMWRLIRAAGIIHSTGYMWRYHPITDEALGLVGSRRLALAEGRMLSHSGVDLAGTWFTDQSRSGGQMVDQSTHVVDALRCLAGEVACLYAWGERLRTDLPGDVLDHSVVALRYESGCIGSLTSSWVTPTWEAIVRLVGEGIDLTVDYGSWQLYGKVDGRDVHVQREADPYGLEVAAFLHAVRRKEMDPIRAPFDDALKTLAVTLAANQSMKTGERQVPRAQV